MSLTFSQIIGLAGVDERENLSARRWGAYLEWPMMGVALWILIEWYLGAKDLSSPWLSAMTNWVVWGAFILETLLMTYLVNDKWRYLRGNWMNLFIIFVGVPVLWDGLDNAAALRGLRLLIALQVFINASSTFRILLARNNLGITLGVSLIIMTVAGILIAGIDPAIDSPWEGIWWAWVTITTVGYGDFVPVSGEGRVLGAILILLGLGLFAMLTASFSVLFISRSEDKLEEDIEEELEQSEAETLAQLARIENRLDRLEEKVTAVLHQLEYDKRVDQDKD